MTSIWRMRAAAALAVILLPLLLVADASLGVMSKNPSPSPSGNEIAFEADFNGPLNIWISTITGSNLRKLTSGTSDEEPAWSPLGAWIAFASTATTTDVWVIHPDGTGLKQYIWIMNADGSAQDRKSVV